MNLEWGSGENLQLEFSLSSYQIYRGELVLSIAVSQAHEREYLLLRIAQIIIKLTSFCIAIRKCFVWIVRTYVS
jgi:hypothetical protein